jgi:hypothetical protein
MIFILLGKHRSSHKIFLAGGSASKKFSRHRVASQKFGFAGGGSKAQLLGSAQ